MWDKGVVRVKVTEKRFCTKVNSEQMRLNLLKESLCIAKIQSIYKAVVCFWCFLLLFSFFSSPGNLLLTIPCYFSKPDSILFCPAFVLLWNFTCPPVPNEYNGYLPDYVIQAGVRAGVTLFSVPYFYWAYSIMIFIFKLPFFAIHSTCLVIKRIEWIIKEVDWVSDWVERITKQVEWVTSRVEKVTKEVEWITNRVEKVAKEVEWMTNRVGRITEQVEWVIKQVD